MINKACRVTCGKWPQIVGTALAVFAPGIEKPERRFEDGSKVRAKRWQGTSNPMYVNIGLRLNVVNFTAVSLLMSKVMPVWPSRGGIGKRLKANRRRFSISRMLREVAARAAAPGPVASTMRVKEAFSGAAKKPPAIPIRIISPARN